MKCADTFPTCGTRATVDDVLDHQCNTLLPYVRKISQSNFQIKASEYIGKGAYGKCYVANLAHMLVCAKVFKHDSSFINEANMLSLCCHENIPWLYGISTESHSKVLLMSLHRANGKAISLHKLRQQKESEILPSDSKRILSGVVSAIGYLHSKDILHNDIKCDNVIVESVPVGLKGILIDLGKACFVSCGKQYRLSDEDKQKFAREHPQIAPDLRDGKCKQSTISDVYSFGRIIKIINEANLHLPVLTSLSGMCMEYVGSKRPNTEELITFLTNLFF